MIAQKILPTLTIFTLFFSLFINNVSPTHADEASYSSESDEELTQDLDYYEKYEKYLKYEKYKKYKKYKKAKDKYAFENSTERTAAKEAYKLYKETKNPIYYESYKDYKNYKNKYKPLKKYAKYKKYKKYNKSKYSKYGKSKYKNGHKRYESYLKNVRGITGDLGEANLGGGVYGPEITVGLWSYSRDDLRDSPFKIEANKDYNIVNNNGDTIATIAGGTITRVTYDSDGNLKIYGSINETLSSREVSFKAADGNNSDMIFDAYRPSSEFDKYRGEMKLKYNSDDKVIWVINTLPLEFYVWGMGEITGTGDMDYNRVMTTSFRTYGYWKLKFSTKYSKYGFKVNATPGNQLYYGYDWEEDHGRIKNAAVDTQGKIVMYNGQIAITPYSSWTDGKTRSFEERWGSDDYPWCQSEKDPYGNYNGDYYSHSYKSTSTLVNEGNHMVGLSAHGALILADDDFNWDWDRILKYYYDGISIKKVY